MDLSTLRLELAAMEISLLTASVAPAALRSALWRIARDTLGAPSVARASHAAVQRTDTDPTLLDAARDGDTEAFAALLDRHLPRLLAYARARLRVVDADDAIQEAMKDLLHKRADWPHLRESSALPFLLGFVRLSVVRTMAAQARERKRADGPSLPATVLEERLDPAERLLRAEEIAHLASALHARCSPLEQEVVMQWFDGRSAREIAAAIACDPALVYQWKATALRKLADDPELRQVVVSTDRGETP